MKKQTTHLVAYKSHLKVLAGLILLTILSVGITRIDLGIFTVFSAILLASVKSILVLIYFMHLKFDSRILQILVAAIFILIALILVITFLDYNYR